MQGKTAIELFVQKTAEKFIVFSQPTQFTQFMRDFVAENGDSRRYAGTNVDGKGRCDCEAISEIVQRISQQNHPRQWSQT